ncbi:hypothetical protein NRIC_29680 [Enterococcus florum]|uniref:HTH tetR-type domain-containing protein n=1 Tax=Enterococcus florum TaxID=2480627 RepID=A0A4P5PAF8_9ENTE|nr:TetR/AcrR family transcriptional regulator [Enterococcus florum]GCF95077.1 hypothetical protein NRIC_29680 [Enterococcus florum]
MKKEDLKMRTIIQAALKEFAVYGYDQASTNRIAKQAGMSKALMFHYIKSKEELFLTVWSYCEETITNGYTKQIDEEETDLFERLRHSIALQMNILKKDPWLLEFYSAAADTRSDRINQQIHTKKETDAGLCITKLFQNIDTSNFRSDLPVTRSLALIEWSMSGFADELVSELKTAAPPTDFSKTEEKLNRFIQDLRILFYSVPPTKEQLK